MLDQDSTEGNDPERVVISAAVTGTLTTREQCERTPHTPDEIADAAGVGHGPATPDEAREILDIG